MKIAKNTIFLFFIITLCVGLFTVVPKFNYNPYLSQGDHGRDLYLFQKTSEGQLPYRDIQTQNGPLMPYYYSFVYLFTGPTIQGTLLGYNLLVLLSGILLFLIASSFLSPLSAFTCALWYWAWRGNEFFYTFNHIGAVVGVLLCILCLFRYIKTKKENCILIGLTLSLVPLLIRPDIGIATVVGFVISLLLTNKNKQWLKIIGITAGILFISSIVYARVLTKSPSSILSEVNYFNAVNIHLFLQNSIGLIKQWFFICTSSFIATLMSLFFAVTTLYAIYTICKRNDDRKKALICLLIFLPLLLMEQLLGTRWFRWIWALTDIILILFFCMEISFASVKKIHKEYRLFDADSSLPVAIRI